MMAVDEMYGDLPIMERDRYWNDSNPRPPYTAATLFVLRKPSFQGSTFDMAWVSGFYFLILRVLELWLWHFQFESPLPDGKVWVKENVKLFCLSTRSSVMTSKLRNSKNVWYGMFRTIQYIFPQHLLTGSLKRRCTSSPWRTLRRTWRSQAVVTPTWPSSTAYSALPLLQLA